MYNLNKVLRQNLINNEVVVPTTLYLGAGAVNIILLDAAIAVAKICGADIDMSVMSEKFDLASLDDEDTIIYQIVEWFSNHFSDQLNEVALCDDDKSLLYKEMKRLYGILFEDTYSFEAGDLSLLIGKEVKDEDEKAIKTELCEFYENLLICLTTVFVPELEQQIHQLAQLMHQQDQQTQDQSQQQQPQGQPQDQQPQGQPFIYYGYTPVITNINFIITDIVKVHDINEEMQLTDMLNRISTKLNMDEVFVITNYISPYQFEAVKVGPDNLPIPETDNKCKKISVTGPNNIQVTYKRKKKRRNK